MGNFKVSRTMHRGKRLSDGEWVVGYLVGTNLIFQDMYTYNEVDPKTISQCTGLTDTNARPIYAGDICADYNGRLSEGNNLLRIIWIPEEARFAAVHIPDGVSYTFDQCHASCMKVVGNIWESTDLADEIGDEEEPA